jgi:hypothetical protein
MLLIVDIEEVTMHSTSGSAHVDHSKMPNFIDVEVMPDDGGPKRIISVRICVQCTGPPQMRSTFSF